MNSFTLSLPFLALIAIFSGAAFRGAPEELAAAAPAEFTRLYARSKARYRATARPTASCLDPLTVAQAAKANCRPNERFDR